MQSTFKKQKRKSRRVRNQEQLDGEKSDKLKAVIKYALLTACGILLFYVSYISVRAGAGAPGGELFFPLLPLFYYLIKAAVTDTKYILNELENGGYDND